MATFAGIPRSEGHRFVLVARSLGCALLAMVACSACSRDATPTTDAIAMVTADGPATADAAEATVPTVTDGPSDTNQPDSPAPAAICHLADGRQIEVGAAFSDGCNCCVCARPDAPACQGGACSIRGQGDARLDHYPEPCQTDGDCAGAICAFNPGCAAPSGTCMGSTTCPLFALDKAQTEYCGCDGSTFAIQADKQYPFRPYQHVGPCP